MTPDVLPLLLILSLVGFRPLMIAAAVKDSTGAGDDATRPDNTTTAFIARQMARGNKPNRLINEKSPYLLQHAFNPVDWYPWGEEAFARARQEDRPIFLSIGYSTCHWCHVMAHESFENAAVAAILNRYFICIKVDREERPDLDDIYMTAARLLAGGGWPLSVFLAPDRQPFYAGTYFPPEAHYGRPGFKELLQSVHHAWQTDRSRILQTAIAVTNRLLSTANAATGELDPAQGRQILAQGFAEFDDDFDPRFGGFGEHTKFPRPMALSFLLRYSNRYNEPKGLEMALATLRNMAAGGIHDHIGGGFHRYSVDERWLVPHFEKMLYDQAQLAVTYLEAYQITGDGFFGEIARQTLNYVAHEMTDSRNGGFYSAEDADSARPENPSQHGEGAFYVWTAPELTAVLKADAALFIHHYGVETAGNVHDDPHHEFAGRNILHQAHSPTQTGRRFGLTAAEVKQRLARNRRQLLAVRQQRPRPLLDDKIITAWNGLMIGAFARASLVLDEPRYLKTAQRAAGFILSELYDHRNHTLARCFRTGQARLAGQLSDYAFMVHGLLELYEASFDNHWLQKAMELTATQIELFRDTKAGNFFDTDGNDPFILARLKSSHDGAEPAGNSLAALNLLRLAQLAGHPTWEKMGQEVISAVTDELRDFPSSMPQMLAALDFQLDPPRQIVIAGKKGAADTAAMLRAVHTEYLPNTVVILTGQSENQASLPGRLSFLKTMKMIDNKATAYVCEDYSCRLPTTEVEVMRGLLAGHQTTAD